MARHEQHEELFNGHPILRPKRSGPVENFPNTHDENGNSVIDIPNIGRLRITRLIKDSEIGCIDGRPRMRFLRSPLHAPDPILDHPTIKRGHTIGAPRWPGGPFGDLAAAFAVDQELDSQIGVKILNAWENHNGRRLSYHDDDHKHTHTGCGHIDSILDARNERDYGVSCRRFMSAIVYRDLMVESGRLEASISTAIGEHHETAVVKIYADDRTVVPVNPQSQVFIYDVNAHRRNLIGFADFASKNGAKITPEQLLAASDMQIQSTERRLAANLPVYNVFPNNGNARVVYAGRVRP